MSLYWNEMEAAEGKIQFGAKQSKAALPSRFGTATASQHSAIFRGAVLRCLDLARDEGTMEDGVRRLVEAWSRAVGVSCVMRSLITFSKRYACLQSDKFSV